MKKVSLILLSLLLAGLSVRGQETYQLPAVPDTIRGVTERADYAVRHFWQQYNFQDTTLIHRATYAEQAVADFLSLLPNASEPVQAEAIGLWLDGAGRNVRSYRYFVDMADKYLYDASSPLHNEPLYRIVLGHVVRSQAANEAMLARARYAWKVTGRNLPDSLAEDFTCETIAGDTILLSHTAKDRLTLLMFYDPECDHCQDVIFRLRFSSALRQAVSQGRLQVLAVCTGDDETLWRETACEMPDTWTVAIDRSDISGHDLYNLNALPAVYLIDEDRRVVQKDTDIHRLTEYLGSVR